MSNMLKFALCNEVFEDWTWPDTVRTIAAAGYDGVEIAPFTLADSVADLSLAQRGEIRRLLPYHRHIGRLQQSISVRPTA